MRRSTSTLLLLAVLLTACKAPAPTGEQSSSTDPRFPTTSATEFGDIPYTETLPSIHPELKNDFAITEAKNLKEITDTFGITLDAAEQKMLSEGKFVQKQLPETNIKPMLTGEWGREFLGLYNAVSGDNNFMERTQANTLFWTADIFMHSFSLLQVELLKEMENTIFAPQMSVLSKTFYEAAAAKLASAKTPEEKTKWGKLRNYFAVPYALFQTSITPLTSADYPSGQDPSAIKAKFDADDKAADTLEKATAFIKTLKLDAANEAVVLDDLKKVFAASDRSVPKVFEQEFADYYEKENVQFQVDFTQFTPRSHYTSSSLRRQYFRAMNWYIQVPFFVESPALTDYAFGVSELFVENPEQAKSYALLESTINFMVGTSDDLMPSDYLLALESAKGQSDQEAAILDYLRKARPPRIKSLGAVYDTIGTEQSDDVLDKTKGMRLFSGKFIIDSYWTGYLTQGDEAPRPGFTQKLPPMASMLEVMGILGSDYAMEQIPTLDFYTPKYSEAIDQAMTQLIAEKEKMEEKDWRENAYTTELWAIAGLFDYSETERDNLPAFMQSTAWDAKNLQAAAGLWTELRHAVLLYAKQSFAELGGGPPCNEGPVPEAPKGYIEPQPVLYRRLKYLAERMDNGLKNLGFELQNYDQLTQYIAVMDQVIKYTDKELGNTAFTEKTSSSQETPDCTVWTVEQSDWEFLRKEMVSNLNWALPVPVEGPVLPAKDKRAALVADVHTGGDSENLPYRILYEGVGVPHVILVAVKDTNGPRIAIGFTYSQYETREEYGGQRMTDEQWQEKFYVGADDNNPFEYTATSAWPQVNPWFARLFGGQ